VKPPLPESEETPVPDGTADDAAMVWNTVVVVGLKILRVLEVTVVL
jgi:hypothetical protein